MKQPRRNVIAQAHSLRGPAGSGAHGARSEPRQRGEVCARCSEAMADCWCPTGAASGLLGPLAIAAQSQAR